MKLKFFRIAKKLAVKSDVKQKHGAVLVSGNKILGLGFNRSKTSIRRSNHPFSSIHSETDALGSALPSETVGSTMYIYRETRDGVLANSRPCIYCMKALKLAGVRKVCYTIENGYKEEAL